MNYGNVGFLLRNCVAVLLLLATLLLATGCELEEYRKRIKACDNCISEEPAEGELVITFSPDESCPKIPYTIREGNFESGVLVATDTSDGTDHTWILATEKFYSVAAEYTRHGKTTIVVNGGRIDTKEVGCSSDGGEEVTHYCWYIVPTKIDVRLRAEE